MDDHEQTDVPRCKRCEELRRALHKMIEAVENQRHHRSDEYWDALKKGRKLTGDDGLIPIVY